MSRRSVDAGATLGCADATTQRAPRRPRRSGRDRGSRDLAHVGSPRDPRSTRHGGQAAAATLDAGLVSACSEDGPFGRADSGGAGRGQGGGRSDQRADRLVLQPERESRTVPARSRIPFAPAAHQSPERRLLSTLLPGWPADRVSPEPAGMGQLPGLERLGSLRHQRRRHRGAADRTGRLSPELGDGRPAGLSSSTAMPGCSATRWRAGRSPFCSTERRKWPESERAATSSSRPTGATWPSHSADRSRGRLCSTSTRTASRHSRRSRPAKRPGRPTAEALSGWRLEVAAGRD
jgi:hypothetical protein